jgi:hypothetical protein
LKVEQSVLPPPPLPALPPAVVPPLAPAAPALAVPPLLLPAVVAVPALPLPEPPVAVPAVVVVVPAIAMLVPALAVLPPEPLVLAGTPALPAMIGVSSGATVHANPPATSSAKQKELRTEEGLGRKRFVIFDQSRARLATSLGDTRIIRCRRFLGRQRVPVVCRCTGPRRRLPSPKRQPAKLAARAKPSERAATY